MIEPTTAAAAVSTGISLVLLWVLVAFCYRAYRIDLFRERMFALRQELFNLADTGTIRFHDPAYEMARTTLNGFIRFGHRINLLSLGIAVWTFRGDLITEEDHSFHRQFTAAMEALPKEGRDGVEGIIQRMHLFVADQVIFSSPLLMLPAAALVVAKSASQRAVRRLLAKNWIRQKWLEPVDTAAFSFGKVSEELATA